MDRANTFAATRLLQKPERLNAIPAFRARGSDQLMYSMALTTFCTPPMVLTTCAARFASS